MDAFRSHRNVQRPYNTVLKDPPFHQLQEIEPVLNIRDQKSFVLFTSRELTAGFALMNPQGHIHLVGFFPALISSRSVLFDIPCLRKTVRCSSGSLEI